VTKSHHIDNLLSIDNTHQAVVSFSLNAGQVAAKWEKAPPITKRIEAASRLKHAGFETRIRIDPMVPIDNWEKAYGDLIDSLMSRFEPDRITLGSLRGLQSTINNARDKTWTKYLNEQSNWGKKIPTEIRKEMYTTTIRQLKRNYNYKSIALCKETVAMWNTLGMNYKKIQCNCLP
jgi:spore photoproduct lyase